MEKIYKWTKMLMMFFIVLVLACATLHAQIVVTSSTPWTEDFETGTLSSWTMESSDYYDWEINSYSIDVSMYSDVSPFGTYCALFEGDSYNGATSKLISPVLDLSSLTGAQLSFQYVQGDWEGDQNELRIYYRESSSDTWTLLESYLGSITSWTENILMINSTSSTFQLAFEGTSYYGYPIGLDNITVQAPPSCLPISSVAVSNIGATTVDLSWTAGGTETSWDIYLATSATDVPDANTIPTDNCTSTTYNLSNLTQSTSYTVYVRSNCGNNDVSIWRSCSFMTSQIPAQLPYIHGFEESTENANWTIQNNGFNQWNIGSAVANTGSKSLYISSSNGSSNNYNPNSESTSWAYRDIDFDNIYGEYQLSFDTKGVGEEDGIFDCLKVYIGSPTQPAQASSNNGAMPAGSELVGTYYGNSNWKHVDCTINGTHHGVQRLYFLWWNDGYLGQNPPAAVDNISIQGITCGSPVALEIGSMTNSEIQVDFTPVSESNTAWQVAIVASGDSLDETTAIGIVDTSYLFTNLEPNTDYTIYVRTDCGSEYSFWSTITARTLCNPVQELPYTENFDGYTSDETDFVDCWHRGTGSSSIYPIISNSEAYNNTGNSLYFYSYSSYCYAALPQFDNSIEMNDLFVSFKMYSSGSYPVVLGIMSNPTDVSTFVPVDTVVSAGNDDWETVEMTTANYLGTGQFVALKANPSCYVYIDNLYVDVIPTCAHVTNVTASNVTTSSADLQWTAGATETAWQYCYGVYGVVDPATETWTDVTTNSASLTGLAGNTLYEVFVRANCGGGDVSTYESVLLRTECVSISSLPYTENFDTYQTSNSSSTSVLPNCWTGVNHGTYDTGYPTIYKNTTYSSYAHSGRNCLYFYTGLSSYSDYGDQVAILPEIDVTALPINTLQLSFMAKPTSSYYDFTLIVGVVSGATDSLFEPIDTLVMSHSDYREYEIPFNTYLGTGDRIALFVPKNSQSTYNQGLIDDITISLIPSCVRPVEVHAVSATTTSIDVEWTPIGDETDWILSYTSADDSVWMDIPVSATPSYTITGLDPSTYYKVRVQADCGASSVSDWREMQTPYPTLTCDIADQCEYVFVLADSYGDGWNGASIVVTQNGVDLTQISAIDHSGGGTSYTDTIRVSICDNAQMSLRWIKGSYDPEASFVVYNVNNEEVFSCSDASSLMDEAIFATELVSCMQSTCLRPASIQASEGALSSDLNVSWVPLGTETGWVLEYKETTDSVWNSLQVSGTPYYVINGLLPATAYDVRVQADCGSSWRQTTVPVHTGICDSIDKCAYTISLVDNDEGYAWDNSYLQVFANNILVNTLTTNTGGATDFVVYLCDQSMLKLNFIPDDYVYIFGSAGYFEIRDASDEVIFTSLPLSDIAGIVFNDTVDCTLPSCVKPRDFHSAATTSGSVELAWTSLGDETEWNIVYGAVGFDPETAGTTEHATQNPYTVQNLSDSMIYDFYIQSDCGGETSEWRGPLQIMPGAYFMPATGTDSVTLCGGHIFDNGGPLGDYSSNCSSYLTINPEQVGEYVQVSGTCNLESASYDFLAIYDGSDNTGNLLWSSSSSYGNLEIIPAIVSTTGPLTIYFESDYSNEYDGFDLIVECVTCAPVSDLTVVGVNTTDATVSWTSSATEWNLEYGPSGFTHGSGTIVSNLTSTTYSVTGLTASTTYDFYVQTVCGADDASTWVGPYTYVTPCDAYDMPFVEDFNAISSGIPTCWNNEEGTTATDSYKWNYYNSGYEGSGVRFNSFTNSTGNTNTLKTPIINIVSGATLSFYYKNPTGGDFSVYVEANGTQTLLEGGLTGMSDWTRKSYDLSTYANQAIQIAFMGTSNWGNGDAYIYLDSVAIVSASTPPTPPTPCAAPTNLTATGATSNSVVLSWTENGNATSWTVNYKEDGVSTWSTATANTTTYTLTGLNASTPYSAYVIANCADDSSDPSNTVTFTTLSEGSGIEAYELSTTLYPNPNNGQFTIRNAQFTMNSVSVYDVYGKLLMTVEVNGNEATIDATAFANGMYFARIATEKGVVTKSFVKK